jgi:hypothetical protein
MIRVALQARAENELLALIAQRQHGNEIDEVCPCQVLPSSCEKLNEQRLLDSIGSRPRTAIHEYGECDATNRCVWVYRGAQVVSWTTAPVMVVSAVSRGAVGIQAHSAAEHHRRFLRSRQWHERHHLPQRFRGQQLAPYECIKQPRDVIRGRGNESRRAPAWMIATANVDNPSIRSYFRTESWNASH